MCPVVSSDGNLETTYKMMRELGIGAVAIKDKNNDIIGVIRKEDLLKAANKVSFQDKVLPYLYKTPRIDVSDDYEQLENIFQSEHYVLVFDKKIFIGIIDCIDMISYLRRKEKKIYG